MEQAQYKCWLAGLPSLTEKQLSELVTRIKLLSKGADKEHTGKQSFQDRFVQTLCSMMSSKGVECPNPTILKKSSAYVSSKDKLKDLASFFETISKSKLVQDSILKIALDQLYNDMLQWKGISVSSHLLLKNAHRIPSTLNRSFPGYAQSGLLTKLVKGAGNEPSNQ